MDEYVIVTEVWHQANRIRTFTLGRMGERCEVGLGFGELDPCLSFAEQVVHGGLPQMTSTAVRYKGSLRWYDNLTREQTRRRLQAFKKRAIGNGLVFYGTFAGRPG